MSTPFISYVDGKPFAVHCQVCKMGFQLHGSPPVPDDGMFDLARNHCALVPCACGKPRYVHYRTVCKDCRDVEERRLPEVRFQKASKVPVDDLREVLMLTDGDDTFFSPEDWPDYEEKCLTSADGTRYFWATEEQRPSVDLGRECSENWLQEQHEDANEQVDGAKLEAAQKLVDEALAGVVSYFADESIAVVIPAVTP